ncbi:hypothetical protein AOXY_G16731 [Acipenser oxyrinchus oxyrinchus]|uniref:Uncharacterized protein n=1 Tax=Acipenser oxyrinchus oxyrinchus TaxID=40147 RepID=A0AAD8G0N2_ACIOX|nr:hypothetical protein AOXY_G16731 [Acipenser oxyrinchus oxyrinchus]
MLLPGSCLRQCLQRLGTNSHGSKPQGREGEGLKCLQTPIAENLNSSFNYYYFRDGIVISHPHCSKDPQSATAAFNRDTHYHQHYKRGTNTHQRQKCGLLVV